jgi:hypothetical protein
MKADDILKLYYSLNIEIYTEVIGAIYNIKNIPKQLFIKSKVTDRYKFRKFLENFCNLSSDKISEIIC